MGSMSFFIVLSIIVMPLS